MLAMSMPEYTSISKFSNRNGDILLRYWIMTYAALAFTFVAVFLSNLEESGFEILYMCFGLFCLVDSLVVIGQFFLFGYVDGPPKGILGEPSMDGCMIGLTFPVLLSRLKGWSKVLWIIPVVAIGMKFSTSTVAVFGVGVATFLFTVMEGRKKWAYLFLGLAAAVAFGYIRMGLEFFNDGIRFEDQRVIMEFWSKDPFAVAFGYGLGSLFTMAWKIMVASGERSEIWMHLHSDFLKIFYETGILGGILSIIPVGVAVKRAWGNQELLPPLAATLFFCLVQYPSFLAIHGFICAAFIIMALKSRPQNAA